MDLEKFFGLCLAFSKFDRILSIQIKDGRIDHLDSQISDSGCVLIGGRKSYSSRSPSGSLEGVLFSYIMLNGVRPKGTGKRGRLCVR